MCTLSWVAFEVPVTQHLVISRYCVIKKHGWLKPVILTEVPCMHSIKRI